MKPIGEVISILDNSYVLAKTTEALKKGDKIQVIQIIKSPDPSKTANLEEIAIPKGKLLVLKQQKKDIYLLTISFKKENKTVYTNDFLIKLTGLSPILGTPKTISETVPEDDTKIDESKSLNLKINSAITIGDVLIKE